MRADALAAGGRGGIRTHGGLAPTAVFKTAALNHSATLPSAPILAITAVDSTWRRHDPEVAAPYLD